MKFINYLSSFLSSETAESSKRLIGILGAFALIIEMFITHNEVLYYCNSGMVAGALGITMIEKIFTKK